MTRRRRTTTAAGDPRLAMALRSLDPGREHGKAWHGAPTAMGVLRSVAVEAALWRPHNEIRCIWEWALHLTYWKHNVANRLSGEDRPFARSPADWPALPNPADVEAWRGDLRLLADSHRRLVDIIERYDARQLDTIPHGGQQWTAIQLIHGIAEHDLWHTAQIKLIKRMYSDHAPMRRLKKGDAR